jgi:aryl-alcohol dehydrogenase-like predicted oxidoreductase
VLSRAPVTAPIVGATRLGHLEAAVRAVELKLDADEIARLEAPYRTTAVAGFR